MDQKNRFLFCISILIFDLNENNCRINGSELEVFDPAIRIFYEKA